MSYILIIPPRFHSPASFHFHDPAKEERLMRGSVTVATAKYRTCGSHALLSREFSEDGPALRVDGARHPDDNHLCLTHLNCSSQAVTAYV